MVWLSFSVPCPSVMSNSFVTPQTVAHQAPLIHGILQARILEWVPISCFRGSSKPRDQTHIFCIGRQILYYWAMWEAPIWLSNWTILRHKGMILSTRKKKKNYSEGKKYKKFLGVSQFSHSVMSDSLQPRGLQHARFLCPSPTPGPGLNSCPLSWWCHPTILSSITPFSSPLQSFPASGSFPMSQFFASGSQSIGASASAAVLPMNIQDWFPLGLTGLISLLFKGLSRDFSQHHSSKASILQCSAFLMVQLSHPYTMTVKTIALTRQTFVDKVTSLLFNMLSCS